MLFRSQNANEFPFENKSIISSESLYSLNHLKKVNGLTVQTVTGSADSVNRIERYYSADIESMEGAAVFYVAKQFNVPAIQLRAISNYVELRNRENWKIKEALASLSTEVKTLMKDC